MYHSTPCGGLGRGRECRFLPKRFIYSFQSVLFLLSKFRIYLQKCCNYECYEAANHYDDEEFLIAHIVLQVARHHAWEHQSEVGYSGTDRVM